jgi:RNA polymerase sigma-70 factor, ECF subfamily
MSDDAKAPARNLEQYREYLRLLARLHLAGNLQRKLDASDVVQQTLVKAYQHLGECRGQSDGELAAWLRQILANTLADAARKYQREVALESPVLGALEESSARLEAWLAADQSSPSERVIRQEQLLRLAQALAQLPDDQRTAVELHHLKDEAVVDIAQRMGRTEASVAGLLRRGLQRLRELLQDGP